MQVSTSISQIVPIDLAPKTIDFYEAAIAIDETNASNYWYLGVVYLLAGREEDAQSAWFTPFATADEIEVDNLTTDLIDILEQAANYQFELLDLAQALLVRQHIWTLVPDRLENILYLVYLSNRLGTLNATSLIEWQVKEVLEANSVNGIEEVLLERVIGSLVTIQNDLSLEIIKYCLNERTLNRSELISKLISTLFQVFNQQGPSLYVTEIVKTCNQIEPNTIGTVQILNYVCSGTGLYVEAVAAAEQYYQLVSSISARLFGSYLIQRTHFTAGNWQNVDKRVDLHRQLLAEMIVESPQNLDRSQYQTLIVPSFFLPYTEDNPRVNKPLQNQLGTIYQQNIQPIITESGVEGSSHKKKAGTLRIGYIGCTLRSHSVGWLSRWLMCHHDREQFQVFLYCLNINQNDNFNHQWFRNKVHTTSYLNGSLEEIVTQIRADEIDILIDLDSLTYDVTCLVMAYKTAPIQISWLGWDASGIPTVDYFIADPYVLPDDAQDYYSEKIWRLPQTYLAVDGFEIGIPTLRREDLDIPADAVVYLSGQSGYKRHPDCIRAQMQIIKSVPNSYFLIKGTSDAATIENVFGTLATEVGISLDRLRFLGRDRDESTHRANLSIADIVLDTFPYNGATTTLETLWMGIPMVTQVGQQFAARNSYTFMLNAGIEEGIAWSQEEYIECGIKLGLDRELRDKIAGKLRSGRTTAPVWNAKQFTLEMEDAYRQMWAKYQEQSKDRVIEDYSNN